LKDKEYLVKIENFQNQAKKPGYQLDYRSYLDLSTDVFPISGKHKNTNKNIERLKKCPSHLRGHL